MEDGDLHPGAQRAEARKLPVQKHACARCHLDRYRAGLLYDRQLAVGVALLQAASVEHVVVLHSSGLHVQLRLNQLRAEQIRAHRRR